MDITSQSAVIRATKAYPKKKREKEETKLRKDGLKETPKRSESIEENVTKSRKEKQGQMS